MPNVIELLAPAALRPWRPDGAARRTCLETTGTQAHDLKVTGSNPVPATKKYKYINTL